MSLRSILASASLVLLPFILSLPPSAVAAESGATHFKAGMLKAETPQSFDGMLHDVDAYSGPVIAFSIERDLRRGFAIGFEALTWQNAFTTPLGDQGDARTTMLQFLGKKYFGTRSRFFPFVGIGIGGGTSHYSYCMDSTASRTRPILWR